MHTVKGLAQNYFKAMLLKNMQDISQKKKKKNYLIYNLMKYQNFYYSSSILGTKYSVTIIK